ncbi:DUF305 domain-containing protein [Quadrisphaera oryzae]|uniref:DUF305 domain-containing protein n=1 Tax=Quadrisphaera TaxID=317661 RepID=UPI00164684F3|nr:DUF305 domain-containing protein [Quadrisphaera sp. RL12-1S]
MSAPPAGLPDDDDAEPREDQPGVASEQRPARAGRSPVVVALAAFAAVALAAAAVLGVLLVTRTGPGASAASAGAPSDTSVEAGFARDMQAHHRQAVTMSLSVLGATDDAEVRQLATDIMLTQQQQAGQMHGWLELWGLPQTGSEPVMAWMGHSAESSGGHDMGGMQGMDHGGSASASAGVSGVDAMPGMATADQLAQLRAAKGTDAERLYLQLMIPHHEAGVEMAQAALALLPEADTAERSLAQAVVSSQTSELAVLRSLLDARGGPLTS